MWVVTFSNEVLRSIIFYDVTFFIIDIHQNRSILPSSFFLHHLIIFKFGFFPDGCTPDICYNHHNRWLCKKIPLSVKFSIATQKTALILHA